MTDIDVRQVDPTDERALHGWWQAGHAASAERPYDAWPSWEVSRRALPVPRTDGAMTLVVARAGGQVVGASMLGVFHHDNTHLADLSVYVPPEQRRRGVGRALLVDLEQRASTEGRRTLLGTAYAPVGGESAGSAFAAATGYAVANQEETKLVDLTAALPTWAPLDEEAAAGLGDYRLEVHDGPVPESRVADLCHLLEKFIGQVPNGDLELEDATWTPQRLRDGERRSREAGRTQVMALAVTPDDRLCGFSDVRIDRADPRQGYVGGTLVLPEHRGHRLGLGLKLLSHRHAAALFPTCTHVVTGNAGVNAPMNAVNEAMGYRVVERCLDVQKLL